MALMDYRRLRRYNQYLGYLAVRYGIRIDTNTTKSYHSAAQYADEINTALNSLCKNLKERKKIIREMKKHAAINIVPDKYFDWMKSSRRAACYSYFWLVSNDILLTSRLNNSDINFAEGLLISTPIIKDDVLITQSTSQWEIDVDSKNDKAGVEDVKGVKKLIADLNREKAINTINAQDFTLDNGPSAIKNVVSHVANGVNFQSLSPLYDSEESYISSSMTFVDNLAMSVNDKIEVIDRLYKSWRTEFGNYPQPFSWIDLDDEDNLLWLWDYMQKSFIGCDVSPATRKQMNDFLLATFDNWAGWSKEQHAFIKNESYSFELDADKNKQHFLARARNAWIQKRHRDKKAKDSSGIKLTAQSKKKLLALQDATGIEPNALLKAYIDDAYKKMRSVKND